MKFLAFACMTFAGSASALGQGLLLKDAFDVDSYSQYLDWFNNPFILQNNINAVNAGQDFNQSVTANLIQDGHNSTGAGHQISGYSPANPGINGNFSMHSSLNIATAKVDAYGGHQGEFAAGTSFGYVEFSVAQPTQWSVVGNVFGTTLPANSGFSQAQYSLRLWDFFNNVAIFWDTGAAQNGIGDFNINFNHSGTLQPGWYGYEYLVFAQHGGNAGSPGVIGGASTGMVSKLNLVIPSPAAPALLLAAPLALTRRRR